MARKTITFQQLKKLVSESDRWYFSDKEEVEGHAKELLNNPEVREAADDLILTIISCTLAYGKRFYKSGLGSADKEKLDRLVELVSELN